LLIFFETHATSVDNEAGLASGHFDCEISETGRKQAEELGGRYRSQSLAAVYCSDLRRSYLTAEIAFGSSRPILRDARLRECHYGEMTRRPAREISAERLRHVDRPYPGGESYRQVAERTRAFLGELPAGAGILVIGHRATSYALEHLLRGRPLEEVVTEAWQWQPGWRYQLEISAKRG
jgi:broad specificity phosphatase PhoE